ncbi:MAG: hypothetical protein RMK29_07465 [Myxococcales bacterium]|nr:hypothetical protein [Myxococcales bacterium]
MHSASRTIVFGLLGGVWLGAVPQLGCFLRPGTVASRFAGEFVCPEDRVTVEKLGGDRFRATGCNRRAIYRCSGEYGELCERIGQPETLRAQSSDDVPPPVGGEPSAQSP